MAACAAFLVFNVVLILIFAHPSAHGEPVGRSLEKLIVLGTPIAAIHYGLTFLIADAILRVLKIGNIGVYTLVGMCVPCLPLAAVLAPLHHFSIWMVVLISPGGGVGGYVLGRYRRNQI